MQITKLFSRKAVNGNERPMEKCLKVFENKKPFPFFGTEVKNTLTLGLFSGYYDVNFSDQL